jgi:hypothetical protein
MSHADSVSKVDLRPRRNSLLAGWAEHPRAFLIAVALGILVGVGVIVLLRFLADTGDEPPIRVKNGSLELHLLSKYDEWDHAGSSNNWKVKANRYRSKDDLQLTVASRPGATCTSGFVTAKTDMIITYHDDGANRDFDVTLKSNGKKISVSSPETGSNSADPSVLVYGGAGFIKAIVADSKSMCTFANATQLDHLLILDW